MPWANGAALEFNRALWRFMLGAKARMTGRPARITTFLCAALVISGAVQAQTRPTRRVLILNENSYPAINTIDQGIRAGLQDAPYRLEFYREYMETVLFPDPGTQQEFRDFYLRKYQNRKPDVIIAVGPSPLQFMLETHERAFAGVPVIFCLPYGPLPGTLRIDPGVTGVTNVAEPAATLEVALRLKPETKHVIIVGGTSTLDTQTVELVRQGLRSYADRLDISYLTNLTMPALLARLRHVPSDAIVLFTGITQDAAGTPFTGPESAPAVTAAASAPVFVLTDSFLGHGEVGGKLITRFEQGKVVGNMSLRVLSGEKPQDIPVVDGVSQYMFDWLALRRWGLNEADLPPGSTVLNRRVTLWQAYRWYILAAITLIVLQTLLIFGLLWHRSRLREAEAEQRQAEQFVRESEERFRLASQAGRMWAYEWDSVTDKIVRSDKVNDILGQSESRHTTGQHILTTIPPEDRERVIDAVAQLSPENPFLDIRHRMMRSDGTMIWVARRSRAYFDDQRKMLRMVGMVADVSDRVQAEQALCQKEQELSEAQRLAAVGSWRWDAQNDIVTWSEELYRIAGLDPTLPAPNYKELPRHFTAESWERLQHAVETALRDGTPYQLDLEMVRPDGTTIWQRARGEAVRDATGHIVRLRGTAQDITERKLAEEALAGVSRKLLEAHEQERTRIARDLHDDISQQLALLSVEIQTMKGTPTTSARELQNRLNALEKRTLEIATNVHSLSHELHSSKLQYLGLIPAMRGFCREFGEKHTVKIAFDDEGVPPSLPEEISLCLLRVAQEGLGNAVKHSGVRFFEVKVHGSPAEIHLTVRDSGVGFDPKLVMDAPGLGLVSMQERVKLVKGILSITSKPQSGTEINVRVPLSAGEQTRAVGA